MQDWEIQAVEQQYLESTQLDIELLESSSSLTDSLQAGHLSLELGVLALDLGEGVLVGVRVSWPPPPSPWPRPAVPGQALPFPCLAPLSWK